MQIEFSREEIQANLQLIDLAVKSGGLNVAAVACVIAEKFRLAAAAAQGNGEAKPEVKPDIPQPKPGRSTVRTS